MRAVGLATVALTVVCAATGCSTTSGADAPATATGLHACGDTRDCSSTEMCVATQGAICQPLPPPGGQCEPGCVLAAHCCNCTTYACVEPASELCPDGPSCACLEAAGDALLRACAADRRQCSEGPAGVEVLCVAVGLDEDPFADAGP